MHGYMTFYILQLQKCCQGKKAARMSSVLSPLPTRWVQTPTHHSRSLLGPKDASPAKPTGSLWPKTLRTMKSSMWTTLPHPPPPQNQVAAISETGQPMPPLKRAPGHATPDKSQSAEGATSTEPKFKFQSDSDVTGTGEPNM